MHLTLMYASAVSGSRLRWSNPSGSLWQVCVPAVIDFDINCCCRYALTAEQISAAEQQLEEVAALLQRNRQSTAQQLATLPDSLMSTSRVMALSHPFRCWRQVDDGWGV